ncbi:MAG: hypothetical protein CVU84_09925 [Firmicutes bacterium HGW-Firmicutes-1]|jgi:fucose permease|nr:MAG: hypothetical protein CVU84_09925 [Firmicutes bacterium HGW-Firmicutes-1]
MNKVCYNDCRNEHSLDSVVRRIILKIRSNRLLWGNFYGFIIMGMIVLFLGSNMPNISEQYHLSYVQGGLILSFFAAGSLIFGFICGIIGDFIGMKRVLVFAHVLNTIGLLVFALSSSVFVLYIGVFIIGAGTGAFSISVNMIVSDFVHGDGRIMSLLHMSFGVGAFIIPVISNHAVQLGFQWRSVLILLVILEIVSLILSVNMKVHLQHHTAEDKPSNKKVLKNWRIYIFMAILFFYVGAENSINGWIVTYLIHGLELSKSFANNTLSVFWIVMMLGRFINSIISQKLHKEDILLFSSMGALAMIILFMNATNPVLIVIIIALLAFMFSGIYPLTFANANPIIRGSGSAGAMITSGGALGSVTIPYMSGLASEWVGVKGVLITVFIALIFMTIFTIINKKAQVKS